MIPSIGTVSGKEIHYFDPQPDQITIEDVAQALSNICRFAGQLENFYSVAQHSVKVAITVWDETRDTEKAMQGLLHDASEAYTNDFPTPLKRAIGTAFTDIEDRLQRTIYGMFGIDDEMCPEVHEADKRWLITERNQLQPRHFEWGAYADVLPYGVVLEPWGSPFAKQQFLTLFNSLQDLRSQVVYRAA
jgi:hypothetical protein